tara:strand:+ start:3211 stop:3987 length:777 start_codon:yes stop_codon:yes gene_type:complete
LKINKQILESLIREELRLLKEAPAPPPNPESMTSRELIPYLYFSARVIGQAAKGGAVFYKNYLMIKRDSALLQKFKKNFQQALADHGMNLGLNDIHIVESSDRQFLLRLGTVRLMKKIPGSDPPKYAPDTSSNFYNKLSNLDWGVKMKIPVGGRAADPKDQKYKMQDGSERTLKQARDARAVYSGATEPGSTRAALQQKYVVLPQGYKPLEKGIKQTVKATKKVAIPGGKARQGAAGRLGKGVAGAFGGLKGILGLGE